MRLLLLVLLPLLLPAADWLNEGGDARRRNIQPLEYEITRASAAGMKLLWKRKLGDGAALSSPVIMGRLITYRGTVELIFVAAADGRVYAVDGDFGKVFWTRALEASGKPRCARPGTPALTPNPPGVDPDADEEQPKRPLYVVAPDGFLHALNPIDGKDDGAPRPAGCPDALVVIKSKVETFRHGSRTPAVAGGVSFSVAPMTGELEGIDHATHKPLFRGGPTAATASMLAIANGHVCFTASDATLYCYGLPLER